MSTIDLFYSDFRLQEIGGLDRMRRIPMKAKVKQNIVKAKRIGAARA